MKEQTLNKLKIIFCLVFITTYGVSQDTLVYKNGKVLSGEINAVSQEKQTIHFNNNNKELVVFIQALTRYKYQNNWLEVASQEPKALYPVNPKIPLMQRNFLDVRRSWSVGTNLTSFLFGFRSENNNITHSIRPLVTLEPEYRFKNNWISLRGTFEIAVPTSPVDQGPELDFRRTFIKNGIVDYEDINPDLESISINKSRIRFKSRYISFQSGLSIRVWPIEKLRERLFFHLGFVAGQADYHAVTIYNSFDVGIAPYTDNVYEALNFEQTASVQSNPYYFTRYEVGVGYNFLVFKNLSLSFDLTVTQRPQNKGTIPDIVYARIGNEAFQKVYEEQYYDEDLDRFNLKNNFLAKVKLIYHFTKK